ncbi:hypothetical protein WEI85_01325 [Actinomycetes bacterium KLBMP 9797]
MRRIRSVITSPWLGFVLLAGTIAVAVWSLRHVPEASPVPVLLGLVPYAVAKYVLCPLRWRALSMGGQTRWWYLRAYAESELLGLAAPVHAAADLWRVRRLVGVGLGRAPALAEVGLDRLVSVAGIAVGVVLTGMALPPRVLLAFVLVAVLAVGVLLVIRWRRPEWLVHRPLPSPPALLYGLAISVAYQAAVAGLIFGTAIGVGGPVDPLGLVTVFAASQLASIVPRIGTADPHNAALAVGLVSLGASWTEAIGAVALFAVLPWAPALLFGGASFCARWIASVRATRASHAAHDQGVPQVVLTT